MKYGEKDSIQLVQSLKMKSSFLSRVLKEMVKEGLVISEKKGKKIFYRISNNPKVLLLLKTISFNPKILEGKREILLPILLEKVSLQEIQTKSSLSLKTIIECLKEFQSMGIVLEEGGEFFLNPERREIVELARILKLENENFVWKKERNI